ncbi:MAG: histidine--tRNA ligase [Phycisphaerales bacterium]|nr:histidine--tRNA ligase [Phycisphaerales bacterium]
MKIAGPKGTRDFYPEQMALRNWIVQRWTEISRRHGFVEYDGPIFERLDLYRIKSGDEIVSQLFHFEDRGGREFAIRPEMTPTLARMVAAKANALPKPIRWFSAPRLCRAEKPQRGRLREFFQWNIDIVGVESELADAECIFVAVDFFRSLELTPEHVVMRINSRAVVAALLHNIAIPDDKLTGVFAALDKRDKLSAEAFAEVLGEMDLSEKQREALIAMGEAKGPEGLDRIESMLAGDESGQATVTQLRQVFAHLAAFGVAEYCAYDMGVVRGLAYYTGTVFEGFGQGGLQRAVCGGGRYDELVSQLGGPSMGGVGFATSDVVVEDLLAEFELLPELKATADYFVIDADASVFPQVLELVGRLRHAGVDAAFSYQRQGVGKQFKQAASRGARRVAVIEPDFARTQTLNIKDMASGTQASIPLAALIDDPFMELPTTS